MSQKSVSKKGPFLIWTLSREKNISLEFSFNLFRAIMSGANSAPVFEQRAGELGIPGELVDLLRGANVNTFARLAYLTPYQPGQPDDQVLFDKLEEIAGRGLHDFEKACFRQPFCAASAITVSELKQKVERVESSEPATLPLAERMYRRENQRANLSDVHF